jgi:alkylation response protein AidB-like acyl-CoA dehydrogenase
MPVTQTPPSTTAAKPERPRLERNNDDLIAKARDLGPILREHNETSEHNRRVAAPVLEALKAGGFQRLFVPQSLGGLEIDPVTCARIVEEIARFDSAAAWSLQSGNVNAWWASRLPEDGVQEIYGASADTPTAAAFHPPQQSIEVSGGFRVTGRAPLASMIHDSDWVLFGSFIMDDGKPRMTEFGPMMVAVIMKVSEVKILDTWHTLGMRGTDSNDVVFTDVFVPSRRTFPFVPTFTPGKHFQGPLYRYPAIPIIGLFSAGVLLAAARGALDEFRALATRKVPMGSLKSLRDRGVVQTTLAEAEAQFRSARGFFYETLAVAWDRTRAGDALTMEQRADLLLAGAHVAQTCAHVTDLMHRLAGTSSIYMTSPLERYFRDAHTLRHHAFVSEGKLDSVGQIYLGLPPDFPLLAF